MKQTVYRYLYLTTLLMAVLSLAFSSCSKEGKQDIISNKISTTGFHTINIQGAFEVILIRDTLDFVEFSGERKHVETCTALIEDSILTVDGSRRGEFLHPDEMTTIAYIHVRNIKRVNVNEDCSVTTLNGLTGDEIGFVINTRSFEGFIEVNCRSFYFWNNPNGTNLTVLGAVQEFKLWNVGLCTVNADYLQADYVLIDNGSQNTCKVRANQRLDYSITNVGNVVYFGNPSEINAVSTSGTGQLIKGD